MLSEALEVIKRRKNFYRDCYHRAFKFLLFTFFVIIVLLVLLIFFGVNRPEPSYYATSAGGRLTQLNPMSEPNNSSTYLIP